MTVNPGFGHQRFIPSTLRKVQSIRAMIQERQANCEVEVDGGIDAETAPLAVAQQEPRCWWPVQQFSRTANQSPQPSTGCRPVFNGRSVRGPCSGIRR